MNLQLCVVPYDTALRAARMGAGPGRLLAAGLAERLREGGHDVAVVEVLAPRGSTPAEIRTAFELNRRLATQVAAARAASAFPITLAGNCDTAVGTIAGLGGGEGTGVLWLDAHGDFNTPETTLGGFLDGMALGMVTGRCWTQLAASVPGFTPVDEENVVLVGGRDLDPLEAGLLARSAIHHLPVAAAVERLPEVLASLSKRVRQLYVHVDLDILDQREGRANEYAGGDGLTLDAVLALLAESARHCAIAGGAATAYDPAFDARGTVCRAGMRIVETLARLAAGQPRLVA